MADLGFVGLGTMGGRMARRLIDAGHRVTGYNRTRARAQWLVDMGMVMADTPKQVAEKSEIIFSMMANDDALLAVAEGEDGVLAGMGPGKVYVDMSTVSPAVSRQLAAQVAEKGASMLDAPVSGSAVTVEAGTLSFMVGGDAAVLERVTPYLKDIGPTITHVGAERAGGCHENRHQFEFAGAGAGVCRGVAAGGAERDSEASGIGGAGEQRGGIADAEVPGAPDRELGPGSAF